MKKPPAPLSAPILRYVEDDPIAEDEPEDIAPPLCHPAAGPALLTLRVAKLARNANFVQCAIDGVCVPVRVSRGAGRKLLKKDIRVELRDDGTYHHAP